MKTTIAPVFVCLGILAAGVLFDGVANEGVLIKNAEAIVGRPLTPGSVAGVSRRTTRRVVRRTSAYVATLPSNCQAVTVEGMTLYQCGGTYYQASGNQYVVVEVQ